MTNPTSDQLNDPEGQRLVQAIHDRKANTELVDRLERSLTRHRTIIDGIQEPSGWCETCGNLDDGDQERHQAKVLAGLRQELLAEAWDQGHERGFWNGRLSELTVPYDAPDPLIGKQDAEANNPYRKATT